MKSLKDHNNQFFVNYSHLDSAGVLCDSCGVELLYTKAVIDHPKGLRRKVICPKCKLIKIKVE